jgi:dienelactone hydrolase
VAVQTGEGTTDIIFHSTSVPAGPRTLGGYLSRPDFGGEWPTVLVFGPEPLPTSTVKDICRVLARHGIAALAPDLTSSHRENLSVSRAASAFLADRSGVWSNAQFGYGTLCFGRGIFDLAALAETDGRVVASALVASTIDDVTADQLRTADVAGLAILSRGDESTDVDESVARREQIPQTTFVVYPTGATGFWDAASEGFDEERYADTIDRLVAFFVENLPPKV